MSKQDSQETIPSPSGKQMGEVRQGNTNQGVAATVKGTCAGARTPVAFERRCRRRHESLKFPRKSCELQWEKIQAIKGRIEAGNYRVEPEAVAERILKHALRELSRGLLPGHSSQGHESHDATRKPASRYGS